MKREFTSHVKAAVAEIDAQVKSHKERQAGLAVEIAEIDAVLGELSAKRETLLGVLGTEPKTKKTAAKKETAKKETVERSPALKTNKDFVREVLRQHGEENIGPEEVCKLAKGLGWTTKGDEMSIIRQTLHALVGDGEVAAYQLTGEDVDARARVYALTTDGEKVAKEVVAAAA